MEPIRAQRIIEPTKTYILQFIYKEGNGWAFVNAQSPKQAESIFKIQTKYGEAKVTAIKETRWFGNNIQLCYEGAVTTIPTINISPLLQEIIDKADVFDSLEEYINGVITKNYYDKNEIDDKFKNIVIPSDFDIDLSDYYNKSEVDNKIETKFRQTIPYIKNGNWWVDNTDTGVQAQGPTGPTGANGKDGKDGVNGINGQNGYTPTIIIGANGNWYIDGVDTGKTSRGPMGPSGSGSGATAGMGPFSDAVNYKTTNWDSSVGDCPPFEWILVTTDENSNDVTKAIWYIGQNTFIDAFGGIVQSTT